MASTSEERSRTARPDAATAEDTMSDFITWGIFVCGLIIGQTLARRR